MFGGVAAILCERIARKKGIGIRVIQCLCVILLIPSVLILSLEGLLSSEIVSTLFAAVVGYVLSGIGKDEPASD